MSETVDARLDRLEKLGYRVVHELGHDGSAFHRLLDQDGDFVGNIPLGITDKGFHRLLNGWGVP